MSEELKNCPFCNKGLRIAGGQDGGAWFIHTEESDECPMFAFGDDGYLWDMDELVGAVNTRPIEDNLRAELDSETRWANEYHQEAERLRDRLKKAEAAITGIEEVLVISDPAYPFIMLDKIKRIHAKYAEVK
jgi:hypothetical protein